jgi:multiple sugar transport system permease protein
MTQTATPPALAVARNTQVQRWTDREGTLSRVFLLPTVVYIVGLVAIPFFLAIAYAFSDVTAGNPSFDWVGTRNFERIFGDPVFWRSLTNTLVFTGISMLFIVVFGKILANILIADFKGKWIVRFFVLLPWTTPVSLSAVSWLWLLDSIYSPIDYVLRTLGLIDANLYYLGQPKLSMASVIAVQVWRLTPLAAVIIMAGLIAIPREINEQAQVDGAGFWRRFFEITIPLSMPVIAVAGLFGAIFTATDMTVVYVLTRGGPNNATQVLSSWAFFKGIDGSDIAQGAAIALFLFPLLLVAAIVILRSVRKLDVF